MNPINRVVATKPDAYAVANAAYSLAKQLINDGKAARITAELYEEDRTLRQNRYYWGCILKEISEQASIGGQRWSIEAWHELFKRQFLGFEIVKLTVAGRRKKQVIRRLKSTTGLKVRPMARYLDEITAFAVTDLGVRFSVDNWEQWER